MNITPTKKELAGLPPLRATEDIPPEKKIAHVKFFGGGRGTWYAVEGSREGDDLMFYGYVVSPLGPDCDEWGYFSLNELQAVQYPLKVNGRVAGHVGLERDKWWKPAVIPELQEKAADPYAPAPNRTVTEGVRIVGGKAVSPEEAEARMLDEDEQRHMGEALRGEAARDGLSDAELDEEERNAGQLGLSFGVVTSEGGES